MDDEAALRTRLRTILVEISLLRRDFASVQRELEMRDVIGDGGESSALLARLKSILHTARTLADEAQGILARLREIERR